MPAIIGEVVLRENWARQHVETAVRQRSPDVEAASPAIEMRDLNKSYGSKQVIDHVDMTFKGGETTVL